VLQELSAANGTNREDVLYGSGRDSTALNPLIIRLKYKAGSFRLYFFPFFCQIFTLGNKILPFHPQISHGIHLENYNGELIKNKYIMSVNFKPLADRVLIEPIAAETKTASGIIIPDTAKEKPQEGTVVAVGPGKKDEPTTVQVGDKVLYGKYSGSELKLDGKDFLIVKEGDLLGVIG
jgi:chaperonin GroES